MNAPLPNDETARLETLRSYEVLDTPPEQAFDDFTALMAHICQTPIALISLVDADRQFFKSSVGLAERQTSREVSFCAHAILKDELFVVPDARADTRFADNPLVTGEPRIRFYAGTPLVTPQGYAIGTLCVIDRVPRELSAEQKDFLRALGRQIVGQLELRRALKSHRQAQEALAAANSRLEQTVAERTAEVERTNASLRAEIAERRQTEAVLRKTEEFNRRISESSRDCIKTLDLQGRLLAMNAHGLEAMEICDLAPLLNRMWPEFWQGAEREAAHHAVATASAGGTARFQGSCPTAKGTPKWWDVIVTPILGTDGKPELLLSSSRDITEGVQARQALAAERNLLRTLIDNLPLHIFVKDAAGRYLASNQSHTRLLGAASEAELFGKRMSDFVPPEVARRFEADDRLVLQTGQAVLDREQPYEADGKQAWFLTTKVPVRDANGDLTGLVGIKHDITERKRMESALREERSSLARRIEERTADLSHANAELARAARLKDEFLANMSHELRTPLHAVLGMSEALLEQVHGPLNERQQKYLTNIATSGRHLLALINDILDLSKIGAGKFELAIGAVPVANLCRASLQLLREAAHQKDIRLASRVDPRLETLPGDERRLKQILVNLLSNAVKFTPESGEVGLEVEGDAERQAIHFTVRDTGIGIAPDDLAKLFQPFVQLDSGLARAHGGTGLGLTLVNHMTEMHGGSVSVTSEPGRGSRFTVSLPWPVVQGAASPEATAGNAAATCEAAFRTTPGPLILLAEDNEANIATLADYLQTKGCRLLIARNGREAVAHALAQRPDLVLMDIQMPAMDGLEATRRLRADPATRAVPIIALTALVMSGDRERCLAAGADEYVTKPFVLRELLVTMAALLQRKDSL